MYEILIENGKKIKCTACNSIFAIKNENEILYRNITLVHFNFKKKYTEIKCKQCKQIIRLEFSNSKKNMSIMYVRD